MRLVRQHEQVEVLVRLDQRIDDERGVVGRHVVIQRAVREQQLALQVLCECLVRLRRVVVRCAVLHEQALIALAPVVLVHPVVVVAGLGDADLEEIRVPEHRVSRGEAAAGVAPDAGLVEVDEAIAGAELLHARHLIG